MNNILVILLFWLAVSSTPLMADEFTPQQEKRMYSLELQLDTQKKTLERLESDFAEIRKNLIHKNEVIKWTNLWWLLGILGLLGVSGWVKLFKTIELTTEKKIYKKMKELASGRYASLNQAIERASLENRLIRDAKVLLVRNDDHHHNNLNIELEALGISADRMDIVNYTDIFDSTSNTLKQDKSACNLVIFDGFSANDGVKLQSFVKAAGENAPFAYLVYVNGRMADKPESVNAANTRFSLYYRILETLIYQEHHNSRRQV